MRWIASEDCTVKGPARAVLWVIAFHADRNTGECWVGQRRLARESGLARSTVQRALDELFGDGVLEFIEDHQGPKPDRFQIAPSLVEGEASVFGMVEGQAGASGIVEGQAVVGEVLHNPAASGPGVSPQALRGNFLVDRSSDDSGLAQVPPAALVDSFSDGSGFSQPGLSREDASKDLSKVLLLQGKVKWSATPAQPLARLTSPTRRLTNRQRSAKHNANGCAVEASASDGRHHPSPARPPRRLTPPLSATAPSNLPSWSAATPTSSRAARNRLGGSSGDRPDLLRRSSCRGDRVWVLRLGPTMVEGPPWQWPLNHVCLSQRVEEVVPCLE
jgi:hypothetical protein